MGCMKEINLATGTDLQGQGFLNSRKPSPVTGVLYGKGAPLSDGFSRFVSSTGIAPVSFNNPKVVRPWNALRLPPSLPVGIASAYGEVYGAEKLITSSQIASYFLVNTWLLSERKDRCGLRRFWRL